MGEVEDRARLRATAVALKELANDVVFVGGSVTSLLITDPAAPPTRQSIDVDAIVDADELSTFYAVEARLRQLGFSQRIDDHEPICRWFRDELIVDIMPKNPKVIGWTNRWYEGAYENAFRLELDGVVVRVVEPIWFLATKLEAFAGRGAHDFQGSRDIEDIVAVIDGRASIAAEVRTSPEAVREYLQEQFIKLSSNEDFTLSIAGHLGGDHARAEVVKERIAAMLS